MVNGDPLQYVVKVKWLNPFCSKNHPFLVEDYLDDINHDGDDIAQVKNNNNNNKTRWSSIMNMAQFANKVIGQPVTNWDVSRHQ